MIDVRRITMDSHLAKGVHHAIAELLRIVHSVMISPVNAAASQALPVANVTDVCQDIGTTHLMDAYVGLFAIDVTKADSMMMTLYFDLT